MTKEKYLVALKDAPEFNILAGLKYKYVNEAKTEFGNPIILFIDDSDNIRSMAYSVFDVYFYADFLLNIEKERKEIFCDVKDCQYYRHRGYIMCLGHLYGFPHELSNIDKSIKKRIDLFKNE